MTSEDAARDRLIYDDLVRFCGDLRTSISSIVARSHTLLSISIAAVIGYFVIFGLEVGEARILELTGIGVFLFGAAFFLHIAFLHVSFDSSRLGWEHRQDSLDDTLYDSVALMVDLAERLTIGHANYEKHYERAIVAWSISWPIGIAIIVLSHPNIELKEETMNRNSSKSKKQGRKACKPATPENSSLPPEARERIPDNYVKMLLGR